MRLPSIKTTCLLFTAFCVILMGMTAYLQFAVGLEPCPLCILQRIVVMILGVGFFLGSFFKPIQKLRSWFFFLVAIIAGLGLGLASRHVWLIQQPHDQLASCGADIQYLLNNVPLMKALEVILKGSRSCSEQQWIFLSLNLPEWGALCFAVMLIGALSLALRKQK